MYGKVMSVIARSTMLITRLGACPDRRGTTLGRCDQRRRGALCGGTPVLLLGAVFLGFTLAPWAPTATAGVPPTCLGRSATMVGHGVIHGTSHADVIVGSRGPDRIIGGGGN